jgi:hypothetical protein
MAMQPGAMPALGDPTGPPGVLSLDQRANWSTIRYTLQEEYGWNTDQAAEGPAWFARLAKELDADDSGQVEPDEFDALVTIEPHLDIEAHFGAGDQPKDVTLVALAGDLSAAGVSPAAVPGGAGGRQAAVYRERSAADRLSATGPAATGGARRRQERLHREKRDPSRCGRSRGQLHAGRR